MKQRLLSVCAALALTAGAFAQSWTAPTEPVRPESPARAFLENAADVEDQGNYYVMNVGEGQFLVGANVWATQISLSDNATPYMQITTVLQEGTENAWVMQRTNDANDKFYGDHGRDNGYNPPAGRNHLFRSGGDGYVDMNNQGGDWFSFTKNANGYYYIQSSVEQGKFNNAAEEYAGSTGAGAYVKFTCTAEDPNIEWAFIPVESVDLSTDYQSTVDAYNQAVVEYNKAYELYQAQLALYNKLNEAVKYGVAYTEAAAVYANASATLEELNAAYEALAPAVNRAAVLASIGESSEDNPIEITSFVLVNPDFTQGNVDGWTVAKMGENLGYQSNQVYTTEETGVSLNRFIEAWYPTGTGALGDGGLSQSILGLPAGRYRLECDAIASWQGDENTIVTGVYLYYNNGSYTIHSEESLYTFNGKPQHFTFEFDYDGADAMTIGLMTSATNANWVAADNFQLFAIGEVQTPATYTALRALAAEAGDIYINAEYAQATVKDACASALEEAEDLLSTTPEKEKSDEYQAAYTKLNDVLTEMKASVAAYKKFADLVEKMHADDQTYFEKPGYENYVEAIEALLETYESALEEGTYTNEQIEKAIEDFQPLLKNAVQKAFDDAVASGEPLNEPIDITPLFDQLSYVYSGSAVKYPNLPDSLWQNTTKTENFKTQFGTAEVWNDTNFDVYRELQLPKGKYTITVKGFYREADNAVNFDNYVAEATGGFSYLYAGNSQTLMYNVANLCRTDSIEGFNGTFDAADGNKMYQPNNQQNAHYIFTHEPYAEQVLNTVSTVLSSDGTLRFGVKSGDGLMGNQWTVWEEFHIYYNAATASDYDAQIEALTEQLAMAEAHGVSATEQAIEKALTTGEKALATDDANTKIAAIDEMSNAIKAAEQSTQLVKDLQTTLSTYEDKQSALDADFVSNYEAFDVMIEEINSAIEAEEFESNEQIEAWINALPDEFMKYILGWDELDNATGENPVDVSMLMVNANLDDARNGWVTECETKNGTDADGCVEFWNSTNFDMHQDIAMLRPGFYRLSVNAFYRAGNSDNEIGVLNALETTDTLLTNEAYLYAGAETAKIMQWTNLKDGALAGTLEENQADYPTLNASNYTLGTDQAFCAPNSRAAFETFIEAGRYLNYVIFEYKEGQGAISLGVRKNATIAYDWVPMDNFCLEYLGTEPPVAVESLQADADKRIANAAIYNLAGQKVSKMQKGIYIVGGKKYLVK